MEVSFMPIAAKWLSPGPVNDNDCGDDDDDDYDNYAGVFFI